MGKKKSLNKILIGLFLGTAIGGTAIFSKTKKGKSFFQKLKEDIKLGLKEIEKTVNNIINKKNDSKK